MRLKLLACSWNCGRKTDRICRICIYCCNERDERNRRIDLDLEAYVPPEERRGHRFYKRRQRTDNQKAGVMKAKATKHARIRAERAVCLTIDSETVSGKG